MNTYYFIQVKNIFLWCLALGFFMAPLSAAAFFTDTETSPEQSFTASELQLLVAPTQTEILIGVNNPTPQAEVSIALTKNSVAAKYDIKVVEVTNGGVVEEPGVCESLRVGLVSSDPTPAGEAASFMSGDLDTFTNWNLGFATDEVVNLVTGQTCAVTFRVTAWQNNMSRDTAGYRDSQDFSVVVTVGELPENAALVSRTSENIQGAEVEPDQKKVSESESANTIAPDPQADEEGNVTDEKSPSSDAEDAADPAPADTAEATTVSSDESEADESQSEAAEKTSGETDETDSLVDSSASENGAAPTEGEGASEGAESEEETLTPTTPKEQETETDTPPKDGGAEENSKSIAESEETPESDLAVESAPTAKAQTAAESPSPAATKPKSVMKNEPAPAPAPEPKTETE